MSQVDCSGNFSISCKRNVCTPQDQPCLSGRIYKASIFVESDEGDWPKYAAEELIDAIVNQMENSGLKVVM